MLRPKSTKFKKTRKGKIKEKNSAIGFVSEKNKKIVKLVSLQSYRLTAKQIETTRASISRKLKRGSNRIELKVFPDIPVTAKPNEVRMGKGKGGVDYWACKIYKGMVLFEIHGGLTEKNIVALKAGDKKLPVQTTIKI